MWLTIRGISLGRPDRGLKRNFGLGWPNRKRDSRPNSVLKERWSIQPDSKPKKFKTERRPTVARADMFNPAQTCSSIYHYKFIVVYALVLNVHAKKSCYFAQTTGQDS